MKRISVLPVLILLASAAYSQVDTSFIYNESRPYGTLDLRLAKSSTRYYYLRENQTFSFRESSPGVRTNTYRDMTAWDSSPYLEGHLREKTSTSDNFVMNYRMLKPEGYQEGYNPGYPLLIMLHGAGETGNCWHSDCYHGSTSYDPAINNPAAPTDADNKLLNNDHNLLHGGKVYLDARNLAGTKLPNNTSLSDRAFPGFVLFPQNLNGWTGDATQHAIRIIRLLVKKYNIDPDRIYITGLSNGGHGVFEAIKRAPWLFSAAVLMSPVDDGFIVNNQLQSEIASIPMWVFQGALDENPYPGETKNMIKKFRDAGAVVRYTEYPDVGHTTWNAAFREPDFFTWMLGTSRADVHVEAGAPLICSGGAGADLQMPAGFLAYQWQRNGQIISGANGYTYTANQEGVYAGRYSRISSSPSGDQWNAWSDGVAVETQARPEARIEQRGTVILRDLNNYNEAVLSSAQEFAHYYWYKDGARIDFPGDQDDTLRTVVLKSGNCTGACAGNGAYTLVTAGFGDCESEPSAPMHVIFSDQAATDVTAPTDLAGSAQSASTIKLTWKDNASNEVGYEIWRRAGAESSWVMAGITPPNIKVFEDKGLLPSTAYQYKIRGVSNTGRSPYLPAEATQYVEITTRQDTEPPHAPDYITLKRTGIERVRISWNVPVDDSGIQLYHVKYEKGTIVVNAPETSIEIDGLTVNHVFNFQVTGVDYAGNEGATSRTVVFNNAFSGLFYQHLPGGWVTLDSVDWSKTEFTGVVETFTLAPKTQEDYFAFRFEGFLYIQSAGSYRFRAASDDGSRMWVDGTRIINNNGVHKLTTFTSSPLVLSAGVHRVRLDYFDYHESDSLRVDFIGPDTGNQWEVMSAEAFRNALYVAAQPDREMPLTLQLYPNPTRGQDLHVIVETADPSDIRVTLINPVGHEVASEIFEVDDARVGVRVASSSGLSTGIYLVRVQQNDQVIVKKVVVRP